MLHILIEIEALSWNLALEPMSVAEFRSPVTSVSPGTRLLQEILICQKPQSQKAVFSKVGIGLFIPSYHFLPIKSTLPRSFCATKRGQVQNCLSDFASTKEVDHGRYDAPSILRSTLHFGSIQHTGSSVFVRHQGCPASRDRTGCVAKSLQLHRDRCI